ncbi:ATP-grasp domain-containing protein [Cupriavidus necator]
MKPNCIVFVEASSTGAGEVTCAYAGRRGLAVVLMAQNPGWYSETILQHCDHVVKVDTSSVAALIAHVKDLVGDYQVVGVTTTSDFHVVQAAALAAYLGLPGNRPEAVQTIKDKFMMRQAIDEVAPQLNPRYALALTLKEALPFAQEVGFPFVAKPLNGNDSLHVRRINSQRELQAYFDARSHWGQDLSGQGFASGVLLEEAVDGTEFCLDLLRASGGPLIPVGAFRKMIAGEAHGHFIKIAASFPASPEKTALLVDAIGPVVCALGFEVGAINIDCKVVGGAVRILEMNPRLVGDQMGSHMVEIATGQNPAHAVVDVACGDPVHWRPTRNRGVAIHRLTMPQAGYFEGITNFAQIACHPGVEAVCVLGERGKWIEPAESNQGVVGSIIASGQSAHDAMALATELAMQARIGLSQ